MSTPIYVLAKGLINNLYLNYKPTASYVVFFVPEEYKENLDPWLEMQLDEIEHGNKPDISIPTQGDAEQYNKAATSEINQSASSIATQNHVVQKTSTAKMDASDRIGIKTNVQRGTIAHLTVEIS